MKRQTVPMILALLMTVSSAFGQGHGKQVTWTEFQKASARYRLTGRLVTVELRSGETLRCTVAAVRDDGLVVEPGRKTRQWARANREHRIPKEEIVSIGSKERSGKKGVLGALAGLGLGAAAAAAIATSATPGEGYGEGWGAMLVIPAGAVAGYYLGHSRDAAIPTYAIVRDGADE